jgi:hypothetical protein
MRNFTALSVFVFLIGFLILMTTFIDAYSQIVSSPSGGLWDSPATWEGGIVPGINDSVVIVSVVSVNITTAVCHGLYIANEGILQNHSNGNRTLNIYGSLTNHGIIRNNPSNYYLDINIFGSINNHGIWSNRITTLTGTEDQQVNMSYPFSGTEFVKDATNGKAVINSGISFIGTKIKLNSDTLEFTTGNSFSLEGGYITGGVLFKESLPALEMHLSGGAHIYGHVHVNAPETDLYGEVLIRLNTNSFTGHVNNFGTLSITNNGSFILNIIGNLSNFGIIKNTISYNLDLNITGNIFNHGKWFNRKTNLTGSTDQFIAFTKKFEGKEFTTSNLASSIIANTNLVFDGTNINLNEISLIMPDKGVLSVQNGYLINAEVTGNDIHFHSLNAYCQSVLFNTDLTTHGIVEATSSVDFAGNLTNEGILRCRNYFNHTITVNGDFRNNGFVTNAYQYKLDINANGNVYNNGIWTNQYTFIEGTEDQNIYIIDSNSIEGEFRLNANFSGSSFTWWGPSGSLIGNPAFGGANSQILRFLNPITDSDAGEYYCINDIGEYSRSIFIIPMTIPLSALDITVLLEGPFNGTDMNTQLNSNGVLPHKQPFFDFPWIHTSLDSVVSIPSPDIVDWVLVELRDATAPYLATISTRVGRYTGFLLNNGKVVGLDGTTNIVFPDETVNNLYLIIRHRNHLDVMSSSEMIEDMGVYSYNFTSGSTQAYGINAQTEIAAGLWGMKTGDGYGDGMINLFDKTLWNSDGAKSGYYNSDYNMKGRVNNQDKNDIWYPRLGAQSQIP